jgi:peptidyl-prolyl cis-trans isomerase SurA
VELGNQVVYGASLAAVAEKSSHGFTAHRGGSYEWTTKGSLVNKAVDAAIFELPLNELSEIIESDLGLHIVRVVEREDERYVPFVEVQTEIKEALINKKREANFQEHVAKLRDVIPVEYLVEPLKK